MGLEQMSSLEAHSGIVAKQQGWHSTAPINRNINEEMFQPTNLVK